MNSQNNGNGKVKVIYLGREMEPETKLLRSGKERGWHEDDGIIDYYVIPLDVNGTKSYIFVEVINERFMYFDKKITASNDRMRVLAVYDENRERLNEEEYPEDFSAKGFWFTDPNDSEFFDSLTSEKGKVGDEVELDLMNTTIEVIDPKTIEKMESEISWASRSNNEKIAREYKYEVNVKKYESEAINTLVDIKAKQLIEARKQSFNETFPNAVEEFERILSTIEDDEQKARARLMNKRMVECVLSGKYNSRDYKYFLMHLPRVLEGKELFVQEKETAIYFDFRKPKQIDAFRRPSRYDIANSTAEQGHGDISTKITDIPCVPSKFGRAHPVKDYRGLETIETHIEELLPEQIDLLTKKGFNQEEIAKTTVVYTYDMETNYPYKDGKLSQYIYIRTNTDGSFSSAVDEKTTRELEDIRKRVEEKER